MLVVPRLEQPAAEASPAVGGIDIAAWSEAEDPYDLVASLVPGARAVAVDNQMWAEKVLRFRAAMPTVEQRLAGDVLRVLRMRKSAVEVEALREAAAAMDRVTGGCGSWCARGAVSGTSVRILRTRSALRGTRMSTSSSSARARMAPARITSFPTG